MLTQQNVECNTRGTWVAKIQEYDLEIKPTKLVRGNTLWKALAENGSAKELDEKQLVLVVSLQDPWFKDITYLLTYGEYPQRLKT